MPSEILFSATDTIDVGGLLYGKKQSVAQSPSAVAPKASIALRRRFSLMKPESEDADDFAHDRSEQ